MCQYIKHALMIFNDKKYYFDQKCLYFLHLKFLNKKLFKQHLSCQFLMKLVFYTLHSPNQKLMSIKSHNNFPIRKTDTCFLQFFTVLNFIKLLFEVLS